MNRQELHDCLAASGVDPNAYDVLGTDWHRPPGDIYCLRMMQASIVGGPIEWATYYSERGSEVGLKRFASEDEACRNFLVMMINDPTAQKEPVDAIQRVIKRAIADGNVVQAVSEDWGRVKRVVHMARGISEPLWTAVQSEEPSLDHWRSQPTPHNKAERGFVDVSVGIGIAFPDDDPRD